MSAAAADCLASFLLLSSCAHARTHKGTQRVVIRLAAQHRATMAICINVPQRIVVLLLGAFRAPQKCVWRLKAVNHHGAAADRAHVHAHSDAGRWVRGCEGCCTDTVTLASVHLGQGGRAFGTL